MLYQIVSFRTSLGWLITISFLLNAFSGFVSNIFILFFFWSNNDYYFIRSLVLFYIIQRAKPCLDFTLTTFIVHFVFVWFYSGYFPSSFVWWILIVSCIIIMCVCGEYLCLKSEMKSIPLLLSHSSSLQNSQLVYFNLFH